MIAVAQTAVVEREDPLDARDPRGCHAARPFVNPNHFAGYVELGVFAVFGLMLALPRDRPGGVVLRACGTPVTGSGMWASAPGSWRLAAMALLGDRGWRSRAAR
jgi:hypothetical protein